MVYETTVTLEYDEDAGVWLWRRRTAQNPDAVVTCRNGFLAYADCLRDAQNENGTLFPTGDPDVYEVEDFGP